MDNENYPEGLALSSSVQDRIQLFLKAGISAGILSKIIGVDAIDIDSFEESRTELNRTQEIAIDDLRFGLGALMHRGYSLEEAANHLTRPTGVLPGDTNNKDNRIIYSLRSEPEETLDLVLNLMP